jgi:DnaK suppressor protein
MKKTDNKNKNASENANQNKQLNFEIIRESLLLQKSEILNRNSEFKSDQSQVAKFSDEADQTQQELQNNVSIQLHERERKSLLVIEKTLSKFTAGTYGDCEGCGEGIGIKRLIARPMASLCISCMEDLEDSHSQNSNLFQ